jgi:hypothetical protein
LSFFTRNLAADVLAAGVHWRNGRLRALPDSSQQAAVATGRA